MNTVFKTFLLLFVVTIANFAHSEGRIRDFKYSGNERVTEQTIFAYVELNIGDSYSQAKADESIKNLFKTGLFSDVKIYMKGDVLMVEVQENSLINKVAFDGNKNIEDTDLLSEMTLKPRSILTNAKVQEDTARIITMYQRKGFFSVRVEPKVIKLDQNRVNLVYEINEGVEAVIRKINFNGNENFSDSELADTIASKEHRWYRFFSDAHIYNPEKQKFDEELINRFYKNRGYADARVTSKTAELSQKRDAFLLTFVIHEGEVYQYGNIEIENRLKKFEHRGLETVLLTKAGGLYNQEEVDESVELLTNELGIKGFPFVDVEPIVKTNKATKMANITYIIKEGYRVYINKLNIKNNTRTLDHVIRREFRIAEGDPYNISKLQRSKQRIENLGFFNKVDFKNKKTAEPDKMDVDVEVEETSTGSLNFAAGYNTSLGPLGQVSLTEKNFLGKGQEVGLAFMQAKKARNITFSFTEPHFMDKDHLSAGFDIYTQNTNYKDESSYNSRKVGGTLRLGYELTDHLVHGIRYNLVKEEITNIAPKASIYIRNLKGRHINSSIGQTLSYDRTDSRIDPTQGYMLEADQVLAGLGGNVHNLTHTGEGRYYYPLYKKEVVMLVKGRVGNITGYAGKKVNINDAFHMGGDFVRGFDRSGIGPRTLPEREALGGKNYYAGTIETTFPLGLPKEVGLKGVAFADAGGLFGTDITHNKGTIVDKRSIRASYGVGVYWRSPMGPIGVHYAIPFRKEKFDDIKRFDLNFSTNF